MPAARLGNYRSAYYIDTAEHLLYLDAQLPSSDPGFVFQAHLTYRCRVTDAADVARRQIRDMRAWSRHACGHHARGIPRLDIAILPGGRGYSRGAPSAPATGGGDQRLRD